MTWYVFDPALRIDTPPSTTIDLDVLDVLMDEDVQCTAIVGGVLCGAPAEWLCISTHTTPPTDVCGSGPICTEHKTMWEYASSIQNKNNDRCYAHNRPSLITWRLL